MKPNSTEMIKKKTRTTILNILTVENHKEGNINSYNSKDNCVICYIHFPYSFFLHKQWFFCNLRCCTLFFNICFCEILGIWGEGIVREIGTDMYTLLH